MRRRLAAALEQERASIHLATITRPEQWELVEAEVERRAEVFEEHWRKTPVGGAGESPMLAATRSVCHDVAAGRL